MLATLAIIFVIGYNYAKTNIEPEIIKEEVIITKEIYIEQETDIQSAITKASELTGIKREFVEAHWRHEGDAFKSWRAVNLYNTAGIKAYGIDDPTSRAPDGKTEGEWYYDYIHFAKDYSRRITKYYPECKNAETVEEFVNALNGWHRDPDNYLNAMLIRLQEVKKNEEKSS